MNMSLRCAECGDVALVINHTDGWDSMQDVAATFKDMHRTCGAAVYA